MARLRLLSSVLVIIGCLGHGCDVVAEIKSGPNGSVYAIAQGDDGTVYLGGTFSRWGPQTGGGAAIDAASGNVNLTFPEVIGTVQAVTPDGLGGFYIGGNFTHVGGLPRQRLAHIAHDGTVTDWNPSAGTVLTIAVSDNVIIIGGEFTAVNGTPRNRLAAIDLDGTLTAWNPNPNDRVMALVVDEGTVYVGGDFTTIGGTTRNRLAAFSVNGVLSGWNPNANGAVSTLAVDDGTVYVGGYFTSIGGTARNNLAAIGTDGTLTNWNPSANNGVSALVVDDGTVYVGGSFTTIGAMTRFRLAAIDSDGLPTSWNPNVNSHVSALALDGGTIYVGGAFTTANGVSRNRLSAFDSGGALTNWNPDASFSVFALAGGGGTVYAGGLFTVIGGSTRNRLAAIDANGNLLNWSPDVSGTVQTLAFADDTVFVGGQFSLVNGVSRNRLAAIRLDGTVSDWNPSASHTVLTLAVDGDTVYVGGHFTTIDGSARNHLAAINFDGDLDTWDPQANAAVQALIINGTTIYAGGDFTTVVGNTRNRLAAIGVDGSLTDWNPNAGGSVRALAIADETVYVGGNFTTIGAVTRNRLAGIGFDGVLTEWDPNANNLVHAMAVGNDKVYVGGMFTAIDGQSRNRIAAVDAVGVVDDWNPNASASVFALSTYHTGTLLVGGDFTFESHGQAASPSRYFAMLNPPGFSVGVTVAGIAGDAAVELQLNGAESRTVSTNGVISFATMLPNSTTYAVTVLTHPTSPNQTCIVTNGSGTIAGANVTDVQVTCTTNTYAVGGSVLGLAPGNQVVLQNNAGDNLTISANGSFNFATEIADHDTYAATILTHPSSPNQTCSVSNGSGSLAGAAVTNIFVTCTTTTYTVGGTASGLAPGNNLVLRNNGGDDLIVDANGSFTFGTALDDASAYSVSVQTNPTSPNQTCAVTNGSGSLAGENVTNVTVACTTNTYTVGGAVSGLASGTEVSLQINGAETIAVSTNGAFSFAALTDLSAYSVAVTTQPSGPNQTCVVANGTGSLAGANVISVAVSCTVNTYTLGGSVTGLAAGNEVVLHNNGGDPRTVSANGAFTFATALPDGSTYAATVSTHPTGPNQTCVVTNGTGTLAGSNIGTVAVTCTTNTYAVGGTVTGLATGAQVILQNNGGDALAITANGAFNFASALADESGYAVSVSSHPTSPTQVCSVTNGTGTLSGGAVTSITVTCVTQTYAIGGTVAGLADGSAVVLANNGANHTTVTANGAFSFPALPDLSAYAVTVTTHPTSPSQTCSVSLGAGTLAGAPVGDVAVTCSTNIYTVGGALTGLVAGNEVAVKLNDGPDLVVTSNGAFAFPTALADLSAYEVTVVAQPASPEQTCTLSNDSGEIAGANVTNVALTCSAVDEYTVVFDLAGGARTGGGALTQTVMHGGAAVAPQLRAPEDREFSGWSAPFDNVTGDRRIVAQYRQAAADEDLPPVPAPEMSFDGSSTILQTVFDGPNGRPREVTVAFDTARAEPAVQTDGDGNGVIHFASTRQGTLVDTVVEIQPQGLTRTQLSCTTTMHEVVSAARRLAIAVGGDGNATLAATFERTRHTTTEVLMNLSCGEPMQIFSTLVDADGAALKVVDLAFGLAHAFATLAEDGRLVVKGTTLAPSGSTIDVTARINPQGSLTLTVRTGVADPITLVIDATASVQVLATGVVEVELSSGATLEVRDGQVTVTTPAGIQTVHPAGSVLSTLDGEIVESTLVVADDRRSARVELSGSIVSRMEADDQAGEVTEIDGDDVAGHKLHRGEDDGSWSSAEIRVDGTLEHRRWNSADGRETSAQSHVPGGLTSMQSGGALVTRIEIGGVEVIVTADASGHAHHEIGPAGGVWPTTLEVQHSGAKSAIMLDDNGELVVVTELVVGGRQYRSEGHADGSSAHTAESGGVTTSATIVPAGAVTVIGSDGTITTVVETASGDYRAYVRTDSEGNTQVGFERRDESDQWVEIPTLGTDGAMDAGSETDVDNAEDDGMELRISGRTSDPVVFP